MSVTVSVVCPAYNARKYIGATIASVLSQSFTALELIVVDDCSTDGTPDFVEQTFGADERVHVVRLPQNFGAPAGPRNVGVQRARGEWIAFIDADDIWHPEKLALQLDVLHRSAYKFCSTQMRDFTDDAELRFQPVAAYRLERIGFLKQLLKFRTPTSSVVVHRDVIRRNPFNEDLRFKAREDVDCWLHCHEELGASIKIKYPLVGYRIVSGQISGRKWQMVRRHHFVLRRYEFRSGRKLGMAAVLFTLTHFFFAVYYRAIKRAL